MPAIDQARRFLQALGAWSGPHHTFHTFGEGQSDGAPRKEDASLRRILHGTLDDNSSAFEQLNERGAAIHVTVNLTDLSGPSEENVIAPRAVCLDFAGPYPAAVGARPVSMIVRSVRGPHLYWLLEAEQDLPTWAKVQRTLARRLGGDLNLSSYQCAMRVPGFTHWKDEPQLVVLESYQHDVGAWVS
ncbi:hypothetical protein LCGC14_2393960 [marine sediment metagenome]|uniref:RepB-like DNA primase domain-containing protein n=1 Tax=marine sediment metagenome TaxID=412755 RepID=A0A0F9BXE4_9ZZZZ